MQKKYFRADKRNFKPGDTIRTAGDFIGLHREIGRAMEEVLTKALLAGKPNRADCLMLFEDENCAKKYWSRMADGKLYTVAVDEACILHRGDMQLTEAIGANLREGKDVSELAQRYWRGDLTEGACVEVLVHEGTVRQLIGTAQQRQEEFEKRYILRNEGPEPFEEEANQLFNPKGLKST